MTVHLDAGYDSKNTRALLADIGTRLAAIHQAEQAALTRREKRAQRTMLAALNDAIRRQLAEQYSGASRFKLKRALLDELDKRHDFPLPPRMVDAEAEAIWRQVKSDFDAGRLADEDKGKSEDQLKAEYRRIAERGHLVQVDAPDLAMERHFMFGGRPESEFLDRLDLRVDVSDLVVGDVDGVPRLVRRPGR